jgi:hypothetical protein
MLEYPRCPRCGTYLVHEKNQCFYCHFHLVAPKKNPKGLQALTAIRLLFQSPSWPGPMEGYSSEKTARLG